MMNRDAASPRQSGARRRDGGSAHRSAISLHRSGEKGKLWQSRERLARWSIAAGPPLVWALVVVVLLELLGGALDFLQTRWAVDMKTLLFGTSMIPFDLSIFVWLMRWAQARLDLDTQEEAPQG